MYYQRTFLYLTILFIISFLGLILGLVYKKFFNKLDNLERLLQDLRDGTKKFYRERRRFPRQKFDISAKIVGRGSGEVIKVLEISYSGALLRSNQAFAPDETIELNLYLPLFAEPVDIKARVVRVAAVQGMASTFNVGVEFLDISSSDKDRLIETIQTFNKRRP